MRILGMIAGPVCGCALVCAAAPALAQEPPVDPATGPPARPLFGGARASTRHSLVAGLSLAAGYDRDRTLFTIDPDAGTVLAFAGTGKTVSGHANLSYGFSAGRVGLGATVHSSAFYYERIGTGFRSRSSVSGNVSVGIFESSRSSLRLTNHVSFSPVQVFRDPAEDPAVPGEIVYLTDDRVLVRDLFVSSSTGLEWARRVTARGTLTAGYTHRLSYLPRGGGLAVHQGRFAYRLAITKGLGLRLGYGYGQGIHKPQDEPSRVVHHHDLDTGLDFSHQLSFSRKTTFAFGTGMSAIGHHRQPHFRFIANAKLTHRIAQTWSASLDYRRSADYTDYLNDVLFGDSLRARVNGSLGPFGVHGTTGLATGSVGFIGAQSGADTRFTNTGVSYTLGRYMSLGVSYSYLAYRFESDAALRVAIPMQRNRHSAHVSVTLWAPLYGTRSRNATR